MNQRKLVAVMLFVVLILVGVGIYYAAGPDAIVDRTETTERVAVGTAGIQAEPGRRAAKADARTHWVRVGPGTVVGVLREYGSERPIEGVEVSLEAGQPGPNELLKTKTRADGGFTFEKVTNFDAWTFRAKAPSPLADAELAGVDVAPNQQTNLGTVYLAPAFGVPGVVVDEKDTPIAGATVRAIRSRPLAGRMDVLRLIRELPARPASVDTATSDAGGKFELRKVPPGRYDFTVEKAGYQLKVVTGSVINPDSKNHPLRFVMVHGFQADGRVLRPGGGPVNGLPVVAFAQPRNETDFSAIDKVLTTTDEKGAFHLDGLGGGLYVVGVSPEGEPSSIATDVTIPTKQLIEITLKGDAWLEGDVTGEAGKPVADAQVYAIAISSKAPVVGNVKSDASGHYVMRGLQSGNLDIFLVQADGYGNHPEDLSGLMRGRGAGIKLTPGRNEKSVSLAKGAIVKGTVKEKETGAPVAGARVELGSILAMFGGSRVATTGADGTFEITSVPKGTVVLMVSKDGWFQPGVNAQSLMMVIGARMGGSSGTAKDSGKGATVVVSEPGEVIERTVELAHGSSLSGTVMSPDGQPVAGAQVSLVLEGDGNQFSRMLGGLFPTPEPRLADAQGHYEIPGPAPGEKARVVARSSGFLDGKSDVVTCTAGDAKTGIDVKLRQGATLSGRVHDAENRPIDGALVRWTSLSDGAEEWAIRWRLRSATPTVTDAKGEFSIANVETGKLVLDVASPRHLPWQKDDVAAEDGKKSEFDVVLKLGGVITGHVVGADGRGAGGATVSFDFQGDDSQNTARFRDGSNGATADSSGSFRAEGLAPGTYELVARSPGAAPSEPVKVEAGGPAVTLTLTQAFSVTGTVRYRSGAGVADVNVALQKRVTADANGLAVASAGGGTADRMEEVESTRTGASGEFELKDIPGGTYEVEVTVGWGGAPRPNIVPTTVKDVQAGKQGLVVEVEPGLTIKGTVVGEDGNPLSSGWVWAQPEDPKSGSSNVNDQIEDGKFELTGLVPGKWKIHAQGSGGQQKVVVAEAGAADVRIEFGGGGSVKILVLRPDNTPAAGVWTWANPQDDGEGAGNAMTDAEGRCEIKGLAPGAYLVQANWNSPEGRMNAQQKDVQVAIGGAASVQLTLAKVP